MQPFAPFARVLTPRGLEVGRGLSELLTALGKRGGKSFPYLGPFVGAIQSAGLFPHLSDPVITGKVSGVRPQRVEGGEATWPRSPARDWEMVSDCRSS